MTEDTNTVDIEDEVSQADFEKEFFGTTAVQVEDDVNETEDNPLANEDEDEGDEPDVDDDEDSEEEEEVEEVPQIKKRNKTQERIEKLVAEARQAERRAEAAEQRLAALEAKANKEVEDQKAPAPKAELPAEAPSPDAKDENGEPLYELGEFDPKFIRDLTKFTIAQEQAAMKAEAERQAQEAQVKAAQDELRNKWTDSVERAEKEFPDLREKIAELGQTFNNVEPNYGEYLASTIMNSEVGPEIMYYLSQNIDEAQKIVASGPVAATLALGRLEAKLISPKAEEKRNTKKVSEAPDPPEERARGRGGRFTVAIDTDDQRAFEREFFS